MTSLSRESRYSKAPLQKPKLALRSGTTETTPYAGLCAYAPGWGQEHFSLSRKMSGNPYEYGGQVTYECRVSE
jgi:hypothetical protein